MAVTPEAFRIVDTLLKATRTLPGVRPERIGLVGHSRGAGATLNYVQLASGVRAAVLDSSGYADELNAANIGVPILILQGTADSPASGGSAFTTVQRARNFEAALRRAGRGLGALRQG